MVFILLLKKIGFIKVFWIIDQAQNARHCAMWRPEKEKHNVDLSISNSFLVRNWD
jgi:hypothetical protein